MRIKLALTVGVVLLLAGTLAFAVGTEPIARSSDGAQVVFVCQNGVAMSAWSAAYFNRLATARGLPERAVARASIPSFSAVPFRMVLALALDGFRLGGYRPHVVDLDDVRTAGLVVAIDTELPQDVRASTPRLEVWQGFPPMREQYFPSRAALKARVEALIERIARGAETGPTTGSRAEDAAK